MLRNEPDELICLLGLSNITYEPTQLRTHLAYLSQARAAAKALIRHQWPIGASEKCALKLAPRATNYWLWLLLSTNSILRYHLSPLTCTVAIDRSDYVHGTTDIEHSNRSVCTLCSCLLRYTVTYIGSSYGHFIRITAAATAAAALLPVTAVQEPQPLQRSRTLQLQWHWWISLVETLARKGGSIS